MIRRLTELKIGQPIRGYGMETHLTKSGTPTMGGVLVLLAIAISTLLWFDWTNRFVWIVVILAVLAMGDLLGLAGVILAVPTAAVVTVLLDELYVKPLGSTPSPRAAEVPEQRDEEGGGPEGGREEQKTASHS